jgi:photosystem II stability/assembly factor-like uncharacterized protein
MGNAAHRARARRPAAAAAVFGLMAAAVAAPGPPLLAEPLHWGALALRGSGVRSLAPAAGGAGILWACTEGDGVWKSIDGGTFWVQQPLVPRDGFLAVAADPVDPLTAYAAGRAGVAKSADGGATWSLVNSTPVNVFAIAPSAPAVLYLAGDALARSDDGGATWQALPSPGSFNELIVDPTDPHTLYGTGRFIEPIGNSSLLFRSTDAGATWKTFGVSDFLSSLHVDPRHPATLYAASNLQFRRSKDRGETWEVARDGLDISSLTGPMTLDPVTGTIFLAATSFECCGSGTPQHAQVWNSADGGGHWSLTMDRAGDRMGTLAVDPVLPGRLYAGTDAVSLLVSGDAGAHWRVANAGFVPARITDLAFDSATPDTLYAAGSARASLGVQKSTDGGARWTPASQGLPFVYQGLVQIEHLVADPASPGALYANAYTEVFRTTDGGQGWQDQGSIPQIFDPFDLVAGPLASELFAVGGIDSIDPLSNTRTILRSLDGGAAWSPVLSITGDPVVHAGNLSSLLVDGAIFAGGRGGLYRSLDGGLTWAPIGSGLPPDQTIVRLRADAAHNLYAVLEAGAHQLFHSADRGLTWTAGEAGLPAAVAVRDVVGDPSGAALYAGTDAGVYVSLDGGAHWAAQNDGLGDLRVTRLAADPAHPGRILAGTAAGLFVSPAPAASPCRDADTVLCLVGGRFAARIDWNLPLGPHSSGHAAPLTRDSGGFWFFSPESTELIVKMVDGRALNGHFWVFVASLSDVTYTLTITEVKTGAQWILGHPGGELTSLADTNAFAAGPDGAAAPTGAGGGVAREKSAVSAVSKGPAPAGPGASMSSRLVAPERATAAVAACLPASDTLCLAASRFAVKVAWRLPGAAAAPASAVPLSLGTGFFWFFSPESVELMVKVLDGRAVNGHFWIFLGGLSDLAYTVTVTDTATGASKDYVHAAGRLGSQADTSF